MTFKMVGRAEIGLDPVVRDSKGNPRPSLGFEPWATVHQTGVNVIYKTRDTAQSIRDIEKWAAGQGKPNEYNYVIDQKNDDLIYEYAGAYMAAHSAGENGESIGVLFLNGNSEPITDLQIRKFRFLIHALQVFAVLSGGVTILQHYQMPGANTSCAKNVIGNRLPELRVPWEVAPAPAPPPPPPPAPAPVPSDAGLVTVVRPGEGWWAIARRVYGTNLTVNSARLQQANPTVKTLQPGNLVAVPGRAV
jgi:hypothetical protein